MPGNQLFMCPLHTWCLLTCVLWNEKHNAQWDDLCYNTPVLVQQNHDDHCDYSLAITKYCPGCKAQCKVLTLLYDDHHIITKWLDTLRGSSPARYINCTAPCNTMQYHAIQFNNMQYQKGILRPKQALFACFWPFSRTGWFQMGYNSAGWVGHSAAMLWTPNKPIFETKNVPHKIGPWKFRYQGQIALFGPPGTQKGPDTRSKCVVKKKKIYL